ncbi:MAG: toll/interleukin-1 receptor domain-containing protein [Bryobacteraceae bacterium]|jgi:hypothetical protein
MPVFISYSHADSEFATNLALQLVKHKAIVWIDQWELHVGDSLITKVQEAIQGASALLVILSKASVDSEWCKKELSSGMIRELEEKRVVILPVLMEDCSIPIFLRDKLYADFRTDFDTGLRAVLEVIARVTSDSLTRVETPEWNVDWSIDWDIDRSDDTFFMLLTAVEQAVGQPFSVLTQIRIKANRLATARYRAMLKVDLDWVERRAIIEMLESVVTEQDTRLCLEDEKMQTTSLILTDTKSPAAFHAQIDSRRLGVDTGRDILIDVGGQIRALLAGQKDIHRKLTPEEMARLRKVHRDFETRAPDPRSYVKF